MLQNDVNVIVNCYDVVSPIRAVCKSDINECYCVDNFDRIYILELHFVRGEIANFIDLHFTKFSSTIL